MDEQATNDIKEIKSLLAVIAWELYEMKTLYNMNAQHKQSAMATTGPAQAFKEKQEKVLQKLNKLIENLE